MDYHFDDYDVYEMDVMERADFSDDEPEAEPLDAVQPYEDGEIPDGAFFVHSHINEHADFDMDDVKDIMSRYRKAATLVAAGNEEAKEEMNRASTELFEIVYSFIIWLLNKNYKTYMVKYREELLSASYLGFAKGISGYNPVKGAPSTWFRPFIQHECDDFINTQVSHTSAHYAAARKQIDAVVERKKEEEKECSDLTICIEAGVSLRTLEAVKKISNTTYTSMSAAEKDLEIPSDFGDPLDKAVQSDRARMLYDVIDERLGDTEKFVLYHKTGLRGVSKLTSKEIEKYFGIKETDVNRIYKTAVAKLIDRMRPKKLDGYDGKEHKTLGELSMGENYDDIIRREMESRTTLGKEYLGDGYEEKLRIYMEAKIKAQ